MSPKNKTDYETVPSNQAGKVRSLKILAKDHGPLRQAARNPADAARAALVDVRACYTALVANYSRAVLRGAAGRQRARIEAALRG